MSHGHMATWLHGHMAVAQSGLVPDHIAVDKQQRTSWLTIADELSWVSGLCVTCLKQLYHSINDMVIPDNLVHSTYAAT